MAGSAKDVAGSAAGQSCYACCTCLCMLHMPHRAMRNTSGRQVVMMQASSSNAGRAGSSQAWAPLFFFLFVAAVAPTFTAKLAQPEAQQLKAPAAQVGWVDLAPCLPQPTQKQSSPLRLHARAPGHLMLPTDERQRQPNNEAAALVCSALARQHPHPLPTALTGWLGCPARPSSLAGTHAPCQMPWTFPGGCGPGLSGGAAPRGASRGPSALQQRRRWGCEGEQGGASAAGRARHACAHLPRHACTLHAQSASNDKAWETGWRGIPHTPAQVRTREISPVRLKQRLIFWYDCLGAGWQLQARQQVVVRQLQRRRGGAC